MQTKADIFYEVFKDVAFPLMFVDLDRLQTAIKAARQTGWRSHCAFEIDVPSEKRAAYVSSLRGVLNKIDVSAHLAGLFTCFAPIKEGGSAEELFSRAEKLAAYSIFERDGRLVWQEDTFWPIAYSTCVQQFQNIVSFHESMIKDRIEMLGGALEAKGFARENLNVLSEYPRQLPTRFQYAAASLGAWVGGAINVQYFACYAALRQIHHSSLNLKYAERIGYDSETAQKLDASGIIALPVSLVFPLLEAQSNTEVFGSISLDESSATNPAAPSFFESKHIDHADALPGFIADKFYRAPFIARRLGSHGFYGTKDVMRDHYQDFYATLSPVSVVRSKHYCVPVVEVDSMDQLRAHTARIPIHDRGGIFFRGQGRLYTLQRDPAVRRLLFGESCSTEPSLTTSASREKSFDYDELHYVLRFFLQQQIIESGDGMLLERWRAESILPDCKMDAAIIALAQHYGLPTHGLDITDSDDVALWFATNRYKQSDDGKTASYRKLAANDWPTKSDEWPVIVACQCVTHSIQQSLHDCHELSPFGFEAKRPAVQKARFFQGGHSDHQNRLAEAVIVVFRLAPGNYETAATFEALFPTPEADPAYRTMLAFANSPSLGHRWGKFVNRFHN